MKLPRRGLVFTLIVMKDSVKDELGNVYRFPFPRGGLVWGIAALIVFLSAVGISG
jgi:hypothetical protein